MKISVLGSTGSIGTQGLEVAAESGGAIEVVAIAGHRNVELLEQQIRKHRPKLACAADEEAAKRLATAVADTDTKIVAGKDGLIEVATIPECDMVLSAIVGFAGLEPTVAAIQAGKNIALANKETLVAAGDIVMNLARTREVDIIPVDSEHSAIFQCLNGEKSIASVVNHNEMGNDYVNNASDYVNSLEKILLTASGGPFFGKTRMDLENVTVEEALRHPNWSMGAKITIDSATLMNKGLEVIEAAVLFDVDIDDVEVVVHRESIIHSMVQFVDGSIIAQLSRPSMKHPIQYAFTYPRREFSPMERVDFKTLKTLTFAPPDEETFRCLALAKHAGKVGGALPVVMNAANEVAVEKFLRGEIAFLRIADIIEETMHKYSNVGCSSLEDIIKLDMEVRANLK